jgi:hypothetical protein
MRVHIQGVYVVALTLGRLLSLPGTCGSEVKVCTPAQRYGMKGILLKAYPTECTHVDI